MADESFKELGVWRRVVIIVLAPIVCAVSFVVVVAILIPCGIWNGVVWSLYWLRYKFFGVPIPPKCPFPPEDAS
jgi:hypothetical protein